MGETAKTRTIRGGIILPNTGLSAGTSDLIVQVEDVSRADAPSVVIGEQRQSGVSLSGGTVLPFTIEIPAELIDDRHSYSVRAHIDLSGSGEVKVGDLVSTQSYPVLTRGYGNEAEIKVTRV
jgi:putative lipoprotein